MFCPICFTDVLFRDRLYYNGHVKKWVWNSQRSDKLDHIWERELYVINEEDPKDMTKDKKKIP